MWIVSQYSSLIQFAHKQTRKKESIIVQKLWPVVFDSMSSTIGHWLHFQQPQEEVHKSLSCGVVARKTSLRWIES